MAQLLTVRLNKSDQQPLGFRLQGGKDFGTPLVVQKVNGGSAAERAGLQAGDAVIRVNNTEVYNLRHQEAQDAIRAAGVALELTVQRGGSTWRPTVTPTGSLPRPGTRPLGAAPAPVTNTSLKATSQPSRNFGSGHNSVAKPFGYMNGNDSVKSIVNKQYNTPVGMYSDKTIAETLSAQTEVLAGGVLGVNFKKNEKTYDAEKSAVFKVLQEEQNDPEPVEASGTSVSPAPVSGLRHVTAPVTKPDAPLNTGGLPPGQNICEECERLITGVFVRIKDKNLHVECFKCSTCGSSLKNQGYYNLNGKLYCDIHAKLVARQNPPAPNLEPVTVPPGSRIPSNTYSTPLPPLATNNYTNGSSSMFSPSSNLSSSGPKPFGSSLGSAYSPSLSPRSAPMSPARPVPAPAPVTAPAPAPFAPTQNIKSIVWPPPPNPPDDDNANAETTSTESFHENTDLFLQNSSDALKSEKASSQQNCSEFVSTAQTAAFTSNVSYSSATMSTATTTSSQSEAVIQSTQSGVIQESTSSVQSFSEHASSQNQSISFYETQTALKNMAQLTVNNPMESIKLNDGCMANTTEESAKSEVFIQTNLKKAANDEKIFTNTELNIPKYKNKSDIDTIKNVEQICAKQLDTDSFISKNIEQKLELSKSKEELKNIANSFMINAIATDTSYSPSPSIQRHTLPSVIKTGERSQMTETISDEISNTQCLPNAANKFEQRTNRDYTLKSSDTALNETNKKRISSRVSADHTMKCRTTPEMSTANSTVAHSTHSPLVERGSLQDALTIAPDQPIRFSNIPIYYTSSSSDQNRLSDNESQIASDIALKSFDPQHRKKNNLSSEPSAFKPIVKQVFPPPKPEEFEGLSRFSTASESNFDQKCQEKYATVAQTDSERSTVSSSVKIHGFSSVKTAQSYFEQLDKNEMLSSTFANPTFNTHIPYNKPCSDKYSENVISQEVVTPEFYSVPVNSSVNMPKNFQIQKPVQQSHSQHLQKDSTSSLNFQPLSDEVLRESPVNSRSATPSLINKPAPIIPHYQMNLVTMEHSAPKTQVYEPSSTEASRSSTPMLRSRSPGQGIQTNNFKVHAPRIKEPTPFKQATSNFKKEHETMQKDFQNCISLDNNTHKAAEQPLFLNKTTGTNLRYQIDSYDKGDVNYKGNSMINQHYEQKPTQSQNLAEYGNTTLQTTTESYEGFEQMQTAKVIEIKKGGSISSDSYQQIKSNIQPSNNTKQVFPPPIMNLQAIHENLSSNTTNENIAAANRQSHNFKPIPSISGANQGPVCDPTPSTGSSVGAAARGKTFGVSSAPKRGRGVLNKAVMPGSRVPLCGSCNGNIRGPFITALGRIWCPEHFICVNATCRRQLQDIGFVEENGQLYCEFCFEQYIAPACDKCHAKIKGDCLNAIGKHFHPECFNCVYCGKLFGNNPFFLEDGLPYCEADWNELFTTKCFACGFPVEAGDRWVEALNNNYHSQCFNCTVCKKNLEGQSFFARGGRPYCRIHAR